MWKVGTKENARILKSELVLFEQGLGASDNININFLLLWGNQAQMPEAFSQNFSFLKNTE